MPQAVWLLADTPALTEAGLLPGEDVHKHLTGCGQAILLAVTLGPGVDAQIRRAGVGDIAAGVASDALAAHWPSRPPMPPRRSSAEVGGDRGKYLTGPFRPGYGDWDIAVQPLVAAALDTVRKAGLCVTDTNLMTPRKSVTALLGSATPGKGATGRVRPHSALRTAANTERGERPVQVNELFRQSNTILLDGGMGTMLQAAGLKLGARPEELEHHRSGAHRGHPWAVRCGGQPHRQRQHLRRFCPQAGRQCLSTLEQVITAGIENCKRACAPLTVR